VSLPAGGSAVGHFACSHGCRRPRPAAPAAARGGRVHPRHRSARQSAHARPEGAQRRSRGQQRRHGRRPAGALGRRSGSVLGSHPALPAGQGGPAARDRDRQGGANRRRPCACRREGAGRRALRGARQEARGSPPLPLPGKGSGGGGPRREGMPGAQLRTPSSTARSALKVGSGRRRFAPAQPVGQRARLERRRDANVGDARPQAREAARGDRAVAPALGLPCPES
jgi:hypothetical protein